MHSVLIAWFYSRVNTVSSCFVSHICLILSASFRYFHFLKVDVCIHLQGKQVCQIDFAPFGKGLYTKGEDFASLGTGSKLFPFIVGPHTLHSTTSPQYALQFSKYPAPDLRMLYNLGQTKYQSYVYCAVHYRRSISPPFTLQSNTD